MDNGQWTMDDGRDYVSPFRADSNIADPTDQLSVSRPCKVRVPSVFRPCGFVGVSPRQGGYRAISVALKELSSSARIGRYSSRYCFAENGGEPAQ